MLQKEGRIKVTHSHISQGSTWPRGRELHFKMLYLFGGMVNSISSHEID